MNFWGSSTGIASSSSSGRATVPPSTITKPTMPIHTMAQTLGFRCFNCGEPGHRFAECKKGPRRGLSADVIPSAVLEEIVRKQEGDGDVRQNQFMMRRSVYRETMAHC
ncbi:hypothetical protein LWI28_014845 [Acer negundo]|uniref:CCHC-type domain-containing protein n=1 Tax=Acer negundo TaxID=4023 RepID=A0AAD5JDJ9_ACENE|nr:hypothetical protein LWI28_014845 [Acer negundo]